MYSAQNGRGFAWTACTQFGALRIKDEVLCAAIDGAVFDEDEEVKQKERMGCTIDGVEFDVDYKRFESWMRSFREERRMFGEQLGTYFVEELVEAQNRELKDLIKEYGRCKGKNSREEGLSREEDAQRVSFGVTSVAQKDGGVSFKNVKKSSFEREWSKKITSAVFSLGQENDEEHDLYNSPVVNERNFHRPLDYTNIIGDTAGLAKENSRSASSRHLLSL